jgi:hypothetical protein
VQDRRQRHAQPLGQLGVLVADAVDGRRQELDLGAHVGREPLLEHAVAAVGVGARRHPARARREAGAAGGLALVERGGGQVDADAAQLGQARGRRRPRLGGGDQDGQRVGVDPDGGPAGALGFDQHGAAAAERIGDRPVAADESQQLHRRGRVHARRPRVQRVQRVGDLGDRGRGRQRRRQRGATPDSPPERRPPARGA